MDRLPSVLDVSVVGRNPGTHAGVHVHRVAGGRKSRWRHGIPVTSPADTLIDLAGVLDRDDLEAAVARALRRRLVSREALGQAIAAAGRRKGIATLRACVAEPKLTRSGHERRLLKLLRAAELPEPETNVVIAGKEIDVYWPDATLAVEVDAFSTHGDQATFEDDHVLDADFNAADIRILRFTGRRIANAPYAVVARIAATLALRLGGLPVPRRRR